MIKSIHRGRARGVFITDCHAPYTDMPALAAAVKRAKAWLRGYDGPKVVVVGGDTLDCMALSSYLSPEERAELDWVRELEDSVPVYRELNKLRDPSTTIHELLGNHEARATSRKRGLVDPAFRRALEVDRVCPAIKRIRQSWVIHEYNRADGLLHIGGLCFQHGFGHGSVAADREALRCRHELAKQGQAYPEVVLFRGHQHARVPFNGGGPVPVMCRGIPTGAALLSPGTLGPVDCAWDPAMNDVLWGHGIGLWEVDDAGRILAAQVETL